MDSRYCENYVDEQCGLPPEHDDDGECEPRPHLIAELAALRAEVARKDAALKEIANHPHNNKGPAARDGDSLDYRQGVEDGHRCAATIARAALKETP
jgi:hypothetical protein